MKTEKQIKSKIYSLENQLIDEMKKAQKAITENSKEFNFVENHKKRDRINIQLETLRNILE